jgi:hypothetical protein
VRFNNEPNSDYDYEEPIATIAIDGSKEQGHRLEWQKDPNGRVSKIKLYSKLCVLFIKF